MGGRGEEVDGHVAPKVLAWSFRVRLQDWLKLHGIGPKAAQVAVVGTYPLGEAGEGEALALGKVDWGVSKQITKVDLYNDEIFPCRRNEWREGWSREIGRAHV